MPGDKSIAHRALVLALLARDESHLAGLPGSGDVASTRACLERLGARLEPLGSAGLAVIPPRRLAGGVDLDAGNSATTARLLAGALAGRGVAARITGDASLLRRPMLRVAEPLRRLGASITLEDGRLPMRVGRARVAPCEWEARVPSAQVKSAFLLAALGAEGWSVHREQVATRDHLERLLPLFGASVEREGGEARLRGGEALTGAGVHVAGDPSSAAFLAVAAAMLPGSDVVVEEVVLNATRTGFVDVLRRMGGDVVAEVDAGRSGRHEAVGLLRARGSELRGAAVRAAEIPGLVDEVPLLAIAAAFAEGESRFEGVGELRHKESDRLAAVLRLLEALGVPSRLEAGDTLVVEGVREAAACAPEAEGDHRLAMAHAVLALRAPQVRVDRDPCVAASWPSFYDDLNALVK